MVAEGEGGGVGAVARGDFAVDILQVPLDGPLAAAEDLGHLAVAAPLGDEPQHLALAADERPGAEG